MAERGGQGGNLPQGLGAFKFSEKFFKLSYFEKLKMHSKIYLLISKIMAIISLGPYTEFCLNLRPISFVY